MTAFLIVYTLRDGQAAHKASGRFIDWIELLFVRRQLLPVGGQKGVPCLPTKITRQGRRG